MSQTNPVMVFPKSKGPELLIVDADSEANKEPLALS